MTTGITSHLHRSVTSLPYRAALRQTRSIARVHAVGLRHTNLEGPMLGRAVVEKSDRAAANQRPGITSRNKDLAKQRFHSSSPTAKPGKNCSITDMMKGQKSSRVLSGSSNLTRPTAEPKSQAPLQNRSLNTLSRGDSQLPSMITSSSDPFKEPEVVDLTENRPLSIPRPYGGHGTSAAMPGVEFDPDDFSDDETLDFDAPFSPPDLPRINRVTKGPAREPPQNTASSTLTWSQSSFSHHQPPAAVKRESPVDPVAVAPATKKVKREVPPAVKRELPWLSKEKSEPVSTVKASKDKKERQPWNINASDAKAQMKQLKQKASTSVKDDLNLEHMHEAMKSNAPKKNSVIKLSDEQEHVKSLVIDQGQSVFFTGPAGTGKSVLMRSIISDLKKKYARDPERVAVTASTGLAACNIGGMTLHSFSGIGLGKEDAQALVKKIRRNPKAKNRWLKTKILVIDEISMVDGDLFDKLSQIGRIIRNNGRPWGGIQLVITGDFFQLPPVPDGNKQRDVKFAFDAGTWNLSIDHTIGLTQVFRQKDPDFAEMLNEMRLGKITERTVQNFQALARPLEFNDGLEVTELLVALPTLHVLHAHHL
ncbi:PIF1-like helicase-domain-containing protein [Podospora aff. communis PSN243]|uniref:ATP-dependent DNA helicase n=1 Tax=Podospora aff. communis PSN243 TaxID=3040156 RepID=A0AAV9H5V4_9PEZI|nr:PIF1-like helicase-domain-containing protein [Podospora aff. communis PSN243]